MKPLVSILIPAYNSQEWISATINSAIGQTWENKEIIVVDDGSRDQTLSVARQFASAGVTVLTQANQGAAAARNKAFATCRGDYIQWLDADDLLAADKIEKQMSVLEGVNSMARARTLLSSAWARFNYRFHRARFSPTLLWCDLPPLEWLLRKLEHNLHMQTATWLVSRELTEAAGPWDTRLLGDDDGEYFCRVLLASSGVKFVPEAKVFYRMAGSSSLSYIGRSDRKMVAQFVSMKLHIKYLRSIDDNMRVRDACLKYLQGLAIFYPARPDILDEAEQLAQTLGGHLETPRLPWKYAWLQRLFGWHFARRAQLILPRLKWSLVRSLDKALFRFDHGNATVGVGN